MLNLLIKFVTLKACITVLSPLFKIMQTHSGFTFPNSDSNSFKFIFIIIGGWLSWLGHWQCCGPVSFSVCFHIFQLLAVACLSAIKLFCSLPFSYQTILILAFQLSNYSLEERECPCSSLGADLKQWTQGRLGVSSRIPFQKDCVWWWCCSFWNILHDQFFM